MDRDGAHDVVIFGGVDHAGEPSADAHDRLARLERRLAQRVPGVQVNHRWSGAIVAGNLDPRDGTGALGFVNAMRDLPAATRKGGHLYVFSLQGAAK